MIWDVDSLKQYLDTVLGERTTVFAGIVARVDTLQQNWHNRSDW